MKKSEEMPFLYAEIKASSTTASSKLKQLTQVTSAAKLLH